MKITIKNKEVELKYSFNSFKYMQEFDLSQLAGLEGKIFKSIAVIEELLLGAVNHDKKVVFSEEDVQAFMEEYCEQGESLLELAPILMTELEQSSFFKYLQKSASKVELVKTVSKKKKEQ